MMTLIEQFRKGPKPPHAALLGFELLEADAEGRVLIAFTAKPEFCNPLGVVQGGFLTAMLDDAMAVAGLVKSGMTLLMPTLELKTSYLNPAKPGRLLAEGRVLKLGKTIAFLEGKLMTESGELVAVSSATARPVAVTLAASSKV